MIKRYIVFIILTVASLFAFAKNLHTQDSDNNQQDPQLEQLENMEVTMSNSFESSNNKALSGIELIELEEREQSRCDSYERVD